MTAVALVGVTASGKSETALQLALRRGDCEIVSVDSMCVYRGMDIGTSKPGPEARAAVPHHLIDLVGPDEAFSVAQYVEEAQRVARGLDTGGVGINGFLGAPIQIPFGGTKRSGVGRELGRSGMDQFANIKTYGIA